MNNQINSSSSIEHVGKCVNLFGRCIRPNHPPAPHMRICTQTMVSLENSCQQYLKLFGTDIPIHNSPRENPRSIRLFGQTITVDNPTLGSSLQPSHSAYPNAVYNQTSLIGANTNGHQIGSSFVNPGPEGEYNGVAADQTNPAPALSEEVIVVDSSSDDDEEEFLQFDYEYMFVAEPNGDRTIRFLA